MAEVGQSLLKYVRSGHMRSEEAGALLDDALAIPLELHDLAPLGGTALATAVVLQLSVYDSFYVVLADRLGVPLVTADKRMAAAAHDAVLLH